jgi:hypothetical protein
VMFRPASDTKKSARSATSRTSPYRPSGIVEVRRASASTVGVSLAMPSVPAIGPGAIELTRIPSRPHSSAKQRIIWSRPAFAAQA